MSEELEWQWHVGLRYARQIATYWPTALAYALRNKGLRSVTNHRFVELTTDGMISKLLSDRLDPVDIETFGKDLDLFGEDEHPFKLDLTPMALVEPVPGVFVASAIALFARNASRQYRLVAITLGDRVFRTEDAEDWELAKLFALQGAGVLTTLLGHPRLHFPIDAVNAVTKSALPSAHVVHQLLAPHLRLALCVNNHVLHGNGSVLKTKENRIYAPYPGRQGHHLELVSIAWRGLEGNSAFPAYRFAMKAPRIHSRYGEFCHAYFHTILRFTRRVAKEVTKGDREIAFWAKHIASWCPGFPSEEVIFDDDVLARALASFIFGASVAHSADHFLYAKMPMDQVPFRMRVAPPLEGARPPLDYRGMVTTFDQMKYAMCMKMFFEPYNVTRLDQTKYGFVSPRLAEAERVFRADLVRTERDLETRGVPIYVPLSQIAPSIQY